MEFHEIKRREGWRFCKNLCSRRRPGELPIECRDDCTHGRERSLRDLLTFMLVEPQCNGQQADQGRSRQAENDPNKPRLN